MIRSIVLMVLVNFAVPASAADDPVQLAESRLNGCLLAGSSAAPQDGLREAVIAVRAFCGTQIKRVQHHRIKAATHDLSGPAKTAAEDRAIRALNDEIALIIANHTGQSL